MGGSIKADKGQCAECGVRGGSGEPGHGTLFKFSICPNSSRWAGRERELTWGRHRQKEAEGPSCPYKTSKKYTYMYIKENIYNCNTNKYYFYFLLSVCVLRWHCFKKMYVVYPHWNMEPEISEIYFLSCWFYKTINRHHVSRARAPAEQWWYCSLGKENWRGLLHLSIFPFSFRPLLVCHGMAKAHFGPSRLSCAHGIT